jgi:lactate permease
MYLSALLAAIPVVVLLGALAFHVKAHVAAILGLVAALAVAIVIFGMPAQMAGGAALYGALFGLLPIGWIVLNIIFLYQLMVESGKFQILQDSIAGVTEDRRLQLLLIAFAFGAFFEGAAGFGTPVAVTGAMLIGLGFSPLAASGLALIANTAPVAFGALGTPLIALSAVTGLDLMKLSAMVGRQLPFFSLLVPFWLIWAFAGWRGMIQIWPAILVTGASFAIAQFLVSNYHGPWLVDVVAAIVSMACLVGFLRIWQPKQIWRSTALKGHETDSGTPEGAPATTKPAVRGSGGGGVVPLGNGTAALANEGSAVFMSWLPFIILSLFVFAWGVPEMKKWLDGISVFKFPMESIHNLIEKVPPVVTKPTKEAAVFNLNWLSATGTGILLSAIISGFIMKYSPMGLLRMYGKTIWLVRYSLLTISAMLALGFVTRYSGVDVTMGLAFAQTGFLYPIFGTLLGWLGVALTGSDTSSNVLFGGLQRTTAEQLGLSPILMAAANSSGGVMGKMIDAQSIVVASTATRWYGHEGDILRYVFWHSVVLAILVGGLVFLQAYLWPFTAMVVH